MTRLPIRRPELDRLAPIFDDDEAAPAPRVLYREGHLCLRCDHHHVCKMAGALDPNFRVVISHCLAFEPTRNHS